MLCASFIAHRPPTYKRHHSTRDILCRRRFLPVQRRQDHVTQAEWQPAARSRWTAGSPVLSLHIGAGVAQSDVTPKGPKADPESSVDFDVDLWRHEEGVREQIS